MTTDLKWWGTWIGLLAVQAVVLAGLGAAAELRVRAPQARRALWQGVLIAVALVWVAEIAGVPARMRFLISQKAAEARVERGERSDDLARVAEPQTVPMRPSVDEVIVDETSGFAFGGEENPGEASHLSRSRPVPEPSPVKWPGWIWLGGTMVLLLRFGVGLGCLAFLRRRMKQADEGTEERVARLQRSLGLRRVALLIWPGLRGPVAFGIWRPTVALPVDFESRYTPAQGEAMLAHELAHLAARDPFWLALADGIVALAWWHPGVWWARRRLRVAGETAADEASALVPSGPSALAESLVIFGRELAAPGVTRALGVAGNGFRSDLSRRVTALLGHSGTWKRLSAGWRWLPRIAALGMGAGMAMIPARAGFSGSVLAVLTQPTPKQETHHEAGAVAGNNPGTNAVVPAKAADHADPSVTVPNRVVESSTNFQLPVVSVMTNLSYTSMGHQVIRKKLDRIRLSVVQFEGVPLKDVLKELSNESRKLDAEGVGINFMINSRPDSISPSSGPVAPPFDIGSTTIKINPPLRNIKLSDVLDAVCQVADQPIIYSVEDYAVVFVPRPQADSVLITRTFRVNPNLFFQGVQGFSAISESLRAETNSNGMPAVLASDDSLALHQMLTNYFASAGVKLSPEKTVFFNEHNGVILVRVREDEVKLIRDALANLLNGSDPLWQAKANLERETAVAKPESGAGTNLVTRLFHTQPSNFARRLMARSPLKSGVRPNIGAQGLIFTHPTNNFSPVRSHEMVRNYFTSFGVKLDPPKNIFFNDRSGLIMAHATEEDINVIRNAIEMIISPDFGQAARDSGPFDNENELLHVAGNASPTASRSVAPIASNATPIVTLVVRFTELPEQGPGDIGLDWLFGRFSTNNPAPRTGPVAELLETTNLTHSENYRVDALRTEGEAATLTEAQFRVLIDTLEQREGTDVLTAPTIKTFSGRKARIEIRDARTIVSGVKITSASPTNHNQAEAMYFTEKVGVGPMLDVTPVAEGRAWRLTALAGYIEFLGYDKPKKGEDPVYYAANGKALTAQKPLPHFRAREARASALLGAGETMALRGPSIAETNKVKGGIFRREKISVSHKRLYIFVTVQPETPAVGGAKEDSMVMVAVGQSPPFFKIGSKAVTIEEVRASMEAEVARNSHVKVQIQPDRDAPVGEVLKIIEAAKGAKVEGSPALLVMPGTDVP